MCIVYNRVPAAAQAIHQRAAARNGANHIDTVLAKPSMSPWRRSASGHVPYTVRYGTYPFIIAVIVHSKYNTFGAAAGKSLCEARRASPAVLRAVGRVAALWRVETGDT